MRKSKEKNTKSPTDNSNATVARISTPPPTPRAIVTAAAAVFGSRARVSRRQLFTENSRLGSAFRKMSRFLGFRVCLNVDLGEWAGPKSRVIRFSPHCENVAFARVFRFFALCCNEFRAQLSAQMRENRPIFSDLEKWEHAYTRRKRRCANCCRTLRGIVTAFSRISEWINRWMRVRDKDGPSATKFLSISRDSLFIAAGLVYISARNGVRRKGEFIFIYILMYIVMCFVVVEDIFRSSGIPKVFRVRRVWNYWYCAFIISRENITEYTYWIFFKQVFVKSGNFS